MKKRFVLKALGMYLMMGFVVSCGAPSSCPSNVWCFDENLPENTRVQRHLTSIQTGASVRTTPAVAIVMPAGETLQAEYSVEYKQEFLPQISLQDDHVLFVSLNLQTQASDPKNVRTFTLLVKRYSTGVLKDLVYWLSPNLNTQGFYFLDDRDAVAPGSKEALQIGDAVVQFFTDHPNYDQPLNPELANRLTTFLQKTLPQMAGVDFLTSP